MQLRKGFLPVLMLATLVAVMPTVAAPPPPVLTGVVLATTVPPDPYPVIGCTPGSSDQGSIGYTVSGTATGPYPGPFTERVTAAVVDRVLTRFEATFTIGSPNGTVRGTKSLVTGHAADCGVSGRGYYFTASGEAQYTATITTPDGDYRDEGVATFEMRYLRAVTIGATGEMSQSERLQSSLDQSVPVVMTTPTATATSTVSTATALPTATASPTTATRPTTTASTTAMATPTRPAVPTDKEQCKHGGWQHFGTLFKNQGQCVAFVNTGR